MAEDDQKPRPFDVQTIRYLVRLMSRHDLSEIDLTEGEHRIRLRRGTRVKISAPTANPLPAPPTQGVPVPPPLAVEKPSKKLHEIKSQAVGTFYSQKEPGAPPYVTVGSRVSPTTPVCVIEAMKVFQEVLAECNGVIVEVCVADKDFVDFGAVLFRVDPAG